MHIHPLITDSESLEKLCERLARSDFVAVDTEFMRENTYWPELCLIQVGEQRGSGGDRSQGRGDRPDAAARPAGQQRGCAEGLPRRRPGYRDHLQPHRRTPHPLFDTQVAAMALGLGEQVGYSNLVESLLGQHARQGRALHRLGAAAARQAPDRLCDRRRHPSRRALPQDARAAAQDRPRRLARPGDGAARRSRQLHQRSRRSPGSGSRCQTGKRRCARPAEGARRLARARGAGQEPAARADHEGRDAGRRRHAIRRASQETSAKVRGLSAGWREQRYRRAADGGAGRCRAPARDRAAAARRARAGARARRAPWSPTCSSCCSRSGRARAMSRRG